MRRTLLSLALAATALAVTQPARAAEQPPPNWSDTRDLDFADRGFIATRKDPKITTADGRVVWDLSAFDFLKGPAPATVNASLWRHGQLLAKHGLYKVTDGVWQVRGFDVANATFIRGKTGWIVIDCLTTAETGKAALDLVNQTLGARKVTALIYTHSHADHFGGARGMVAQAEVDSGAVQVIAPKGFVEQAVSENVIAGAAMGRRATYQFGLYLPKGPEGTVGSGVGQSVALGTQTLVPPNVSIDHTGQTLTVDGVTLEFQMTPGTEAPAEMNIWLPDFKVLDLAENGNETMHNVLTPRGALVRDARVWAEYLNQSLSLYAGKADIMITSHAWPRFGRETLIDFIGKHRDAYKYLHDQTVRMMDEGMTGDEIADRIVLPPALASEWYNRGYYGSMSFNSRAVYQRYMGWYDANPVHLAPYPQKEEARRYVEAMGGAAKVADMAAAAAKAGDLRWAAELGNRLVMADSANTSARAALAEVYLKLGEASENALWRNMYLAGADELKHGLHPVQAVSLGLDLIRNTPSPMLMDLLAVRLNADKVGAAHASLDLTFTDRGEHFRVTVRNGVLVASDQALPGDGPADLTLSLPRQAFLMLTFTPARITDLIKAGTVKAQGDPEVFDRFVGWMDTFRADFPIVWR